jgi:crotonobetainyl-CoA:carnitine CoA-transferase CaiB-like acyl-CoA transferase
LKGIAVAERISGQATGPLSGVRVLDLTQVVMGPYATQILGDLGADVITIEPPNGDPLRAIGTGAHPQLGGAALNMLRNKRNVALDLKLPDGMSAFTKLLASCDVFITNMRPEPLARLRLTYEALADVKQDLIYCEAHGFPTESARANEAAFDDAIQASAGVAALMGKLYGTPALIPTVLADKVSGLVIAYAVSAALYHRSLTGRGQRIEVPMHDVVSAFVLAEHGADAIQQPPLGPPGYGRLLTLNRKPYRTLDGFVLLIPYSRRNWVDLFKAGGLERPEHDLRLASASSRSQHYDRLYAEVADIVRTRTTAYWRQWSEEHGIASSEIATLEDLVADLPEAVHPVSGRYKTIPPPVRFSITPQDVRRPAPLIGENNREVLAEIGFSDGELDALEVCGALNAGPSVVA